MKAFLLTILPLFIIINLSAQDTIFLRTGEEKEVIVKKVGVTTVEYVRYDNRQGALYEVLKDDISMIKYQNGTTDLFEQNEPMGVEASNREEGTFIDERDGEEYRWVKIGTQVWMKDNLRFNTGTSPCYELKHAVCGACGRYYTYDEALVACPAGWHLPQDSEWIKLETEVGMTKEKANKIGWRGTGTGQAPNILKGGVSGLDILLCGYGEVFYYDKSPIFSMDLKDNKGYYWTGTNSEYYPNRAYDRELSRRLSIRRVYLSEKILASVRCVKDTE